MSKTIQLWNVPNALYRRHKARAAAAGISLSEYLLLEIKEIANMPTLVETREHLHRREPVRAKFDTARMIREERDGRQSSRRGRN